MSADTPALPPAGMVEVSYDRFFEAVYAMPGDIMPTLRNTPPWHPTLGYRSEWRDQKTGGPVVGVSYTNRYFLRG